MLRPNGPLLVLVASLAGACAFDGSTEFEPVFDEPLADSEEAGDVVPEPAPEGDEVIAFHAIAEDTREGSLVAGSFEDSFAVDGVVEVIEGEIRRDEERLEHTWEFDVVAAGAHELTLVGLPYSPEPVDSFELEYAVDGVRGHTLILNLDATNQVMTFVGEVELEAAARIEVRVKLPRDTEAPDEDEVPFRRIDVDYLALTPVVF